MTAVSQDIETAGNLREFLQALHRKLQDSDEGFPFPAAKKQCGMVLNRMAADFKTASEKVDRQIHTAGEYLLVLVCESDCPELPRRLLSLGVDPDCATLVSRKRSGITPLAMAARSGHLGVCRVLVEGGADVEKPRQCSAGELDASPLLLAAQAGHVEVTR